MIRPIMKGSGEASCHMAVCHMELNLGSANEENTPLVTKSKLEGDGITKVLKSLGVDDDVIQKASYRNIQRMLESAIRDSFNTEDDEYFYIYLNDFDESTAVFDYKDKVYSVTYSLTENGIVLLGSDIKEVVRQDVYVAADGSALVLKEVGNIDVKNPAEIAEDEGEGLPSDISQEKENNMSKVEYSQEEIDSLLQKATNEAIKGQEELILKAKAAWEKEAKDAEIIKSTSAILKGYSFIADGEVEQVVKSLVTLDLDAMNTVLKALSGAKEAIDAEVAAKQVEIDAKEEIKKEFGKQESSDETPTLDANDTKAILKANVAAAKARNKA